MRAHLLGLLAACGARTTVDLPGSSQTASPSTAPGPRFRVVAISAGRSHSCAVRSDGTVVCWGADDLGQLGNGTTNALTNAPVVVPGIDDAVALSAGPDYSCVVRSGGTVACWGSGSQGLVEAGAIVVRAPADVHGADNAMAITTGLGSACFLRATARCRAGRGWRNPSIW